MSCFQSKQMQQNKDSEIMSYSFGNRELRIKCSSFCFAEIFENFFRRHDNIYMQGQIFASRLERRRRMAAMNNDEFERFVLKFGKDILRFCRMTAGDAENGDELYQDTMLKLLEKRKRLDSMQNTKSYALSTSIYLWKNRKKKYANRMRLVPIDSMDEMSDEGYEFTDYDNEISPEHIVLKQNEIDMVQGFVKTLPEKYRIPIYLYYSADMQINEISKILGLPEGTVKSRMRKAKKQLKEKLEAIGYDG